MNHHMEELKILSMKVFDIGIFSYKENFLLLYLRLLLYSVSPQVNFGTSGKILKTKKISDKYNKLLLKSIKFLLVEVGLQMITSSTIFSKL